MRLLALVAATLCASVGALEASGDEVPLKDGSGLLHVSIFGKFGARQVVIVIPGGPGLSADYLLPLAQLAGDDRQIVFYEPRGVGKSTAPATGATTGLTTQVADLDAIRGWVGAQTVLVLGHSWGTVTAIAYAVAHPERTAGLVLIGMGAPTAAEDRRTFSAAFGARKAELAKQGLIRAHGDDGSDCMASFVAALPAHFADPRHPGAQHLDGTYRCGVGHAMIDAAGAWDFRNTLAALDKLPMLLVIGDADANLVGFRETEAIVAGAEDVTKIKLNQCGHFPWIECPDAFFGAMTRFLDRH